jgi:hypothetical protein
MPKKDPAKDSMTDRRSVLRAGAKLPYIVPAVLTAVTVSQSKLAAASAPGPVGPPVWF